MQPISEFWICWGRPRKASAGLRAAGAAASMTVTAAAHPLSESGMIAPAAPFAYPSATKRGVGFSLTLTGAAHLTPCVRRALFGRGRVKRPSLTVRKMRVRTVNVTRRRIIKGKSPLTLVTPTIVFRTVVTPVVIWVSFRTTLAPLAGRRWRRPSGLISERLDWRGQTDNGQRTLT